MKNTINLIFKKRNIKIIIVIFVVIISCVFVIDMEKNKNSLSNIVMKFDYESGKRTYFYSTDNFISPDGNSILGVDPENTEKHKKLLNKGYKKFTLLQGLAFPVFRDKEGNFIWPYVYVGPNNRPEPGSLEYELTYLGKRDEKDDRYLEYGQLANPNMDGYYRIKVPRKDCTIILVFIPDKDAIPRFFDTKMSTSNMHKNNFSIEIPLIENLPTVQGELYNFIKDNDEVKEYLSYKEHIHN